MEEQSVCGHVVIGRDGRAECVWSCSQGNDPVETAGTCKQEEREINQTPKMLRGFVLILKERGREGGLQCQYNVRLKGVGSQKAAVQRRKNIASLV